MSMTVCDACGNYIDSDYDVECYVVVITRNHDESIAKRRDMCLCAHCRDAGWFEIQEEP